MFLRFAISFEMRGAKVVQHHCLWHRLLILPATLLIVVGSGLRAAAGSEDIFAPYHEEIRESLPSGWLMRLPSEVPSRGLGEGTQSQYRVQVMSGEEAVGLTVSLFNCEDESPGCLVGSFAVNSPASVEKAWQLHQAGAAPITLAKGVQGYFLEGSRQNSPSPFSSVMWEQKGLIYTVRFLAQERQNILWMAYAMANQTPIASAVAGGDEGEEAIVATPPPVPRVEQVALPAEIFTPVLEEIKASLPAGWGMLLPDEVLLREDIEVGERKYHAQVLSPSAGVGLTVGIFTCKDDLFSCLVGSFSVESEASEEAQRRFWQHQASAAPITLAPNVKGYQRLEPFIPNPPSQFYSVMWRQDGRFCTVRFSAQERQNILWMALSMANQTPIVSTATAALKPGVVSTGDNASPPVLAVNLEEEPVEQDNSSASESDSQEPEELCTNHSEEQTTAELIEIKGKNISIQVKGSTVFGSDEIEEAVTPIIEQSEAEEIKKEKLIEDINNQITQLYLEKGYITSRSVVKTNQSNIDNGVVEIEVIEGSLRKIEIKGRKRLNKNYICSRIGLGVGIPLNTTQLEEQLRLLRSNPLFENVEASLLAAEEGKGKSDLIVTVTEAAPLVLNFNVDNYSPPSVGSERLGIGLLYRNLTGSGDELSAAYSRSTTGGAEVFDFSWKVPVNPMEGTLLVRVAPNRNEVTQSEFQALGIRGERELYEIFFRQPLVRTTREELALSVGFSYQDGQTFLFDREPFGFGIGPDEDGVSRTSVFKFGQDYVRRDRQGAWSWRSELSFGTNLFNATTNEGSIPDGQFFSWLTQVQRVQRLGEDHLLVIEADLQLTPDGLLPAHQFVLGGGQSLRGYRQNDRSGDNGFRFSIEDRFTILRDEGGEARLQIVPFVDLGAIWNVSGNPNVLPDQTFLLGAGLGLRWFNVVGIDGLSLYLDYAFPFFDLDEQGGNLQDEGFYFQVNYQQNLDLFWDGGEGE